MMVQTSTENIIADLGGGLIMRRSGSADGARLAAFNAMIHGEDEYEQKGIAAWTADLLEKPHPTFHPDDFLIVEDSASGQVVSTMNLISQVWSYEGIPFGVGRPELVGTAAAYRRRGLVRKQFEVIHEWSRERGELVLAITGIPNFYRQYGYEMGLNLGGGRQGYLPHLPKLKEGEQEPYHMRLALESDIPWLQKMYERENHYSMIYAVLDEALWRYELSGKSEDNINRSVTYVIEAQDGCTVGYLVCPKTLWGTSSPLLRYALDEGVSYLAVTPSVIRFLWQKGQQHAATLERTVESFYFNLGADHPAYRAAFDRLPKERRPYAFFVRVPDLPAFLRCIAPVLERRLVDSPAAGHTGELKISFYRSGLRMVFEKGRLVTVENWSPVVKEDEGMVALPDLTFLQLVFGYQTLEGLRLQYADCWATGEASVLLEALFPKKPSNIWVVS